MKLWKRAGTAGVLTVLLLGAGSALAQKSDDLKFSLGLKLWANTWETSFANNDPSTGTNVISSTSDYKIAAIPSFSVRYKDFVASMGYFTKTSYSFKDFSDMTNLACCGPKEVTTAVSAKRDELDVNFGYFVAPQLAVTLGYKSVNQTYTVTNSAPGVIFTPATFTSKTKNTAPTIGILSFAPLGGGFTLYGNGAYGPMKSKIEGGGSAKGSYQSTELGVARGFGNTGLSASLGYKVQIIDVKDTVTTGDQRARDTTNGFILGVTYTF